MCLRVVEKVNCFSLYKAMTSYKAANSFLNQCQFERKSQVQFDARVVFL